MSWLLKTGLPRCGVFLGLAAICAAGCGNSGEPQLPERNFLIVVESSAYEPLRETLDGYAELMQLGRFNVHVESFVPGTVEDLKALLFDHVDMHDIEGALLIGELPAAWYEQVAFSYHEEFPTDIYLQDRDAVWTDEDGDGIFDHHSDLNLDIYTARLNGTSTQLQDYFARARYYRRVGPLVDVSAFIFIDDDWSSANTSDEFHLGELYSNVNVLQDEADSTFANYLARLTGSGAEFVYQWIHSAPLFLSIHDQDEQGKLFYSKVLSRDIAKHDLKASFFNLFDCSAARFTGENLAEEYVVATDYGLAAIGSTKTGAVNDPHFFHEIWSSAGAGVKPTRCGSTRWANGTTRGTSASCSSGILC